MLSPRDAVNQLLPVPQIILSIFFLGLISPEASADTKRQVKEAITELQDLSRENQSGYQAWRKHSIAELAAGARVIETKVGPIQYKKRGHGPVVICLHGGFGGYDQAYLMGSFLVNRGFTVVALSRPGYLGTPISVGKTVNQQADATVYLMDALGIKKAIIYGFSAGSPIAFQVGFRHPERVNAVVVTGVGAPPQDAPYYQLITAFLKANIGIDLLPYGLYLLAQNDLRAAGDLMFLIDTNLGLAARAHRMNYALGNPSQRTFMKRLAISLTPLSVRREGLIADLSVLSTWGSYAKNGLLQKLKPPMLFVDARNDANGSYPQTVRYTDKVPDSVLITVRESGHFIWLGPNTTNWENRMVRFLKNHAVGQSR